MYRVLPGSIFKHYRGSFVEVVANKYNELTNQQTVSYRTFNPVSISKPVETTSSITNVDINEFIKNAPNGREYPEYEYICHIDELHQI